MFTVLLHIGAMSRALSREFSAKIMAWYREHKRPLPWRDTKEPYKIWLSEIILQQTRVNQGLPYYLKFVATYPTVQALAAASEQEVLRLWQGLGYYSRARNLHACAKRITAEFNGKFPNSYTALKELPGIGEYTAAAIASVCFGEPVAVVDGNVYRVLSRVFGIETDIGTPAAKREFFELGNKLISHQAPDEYNQAAMEFGALHCTPVNPLCGDCPLAKNCIAKQRGLQSSFPVKEKKQKERRRYFYYWVQAKGKSIAMRKREGKDIWQGLYDFPLIERKRPVKESSLLRELGITKAKVTAPYKHVLSHQIIFARFIVTPQSPNTPASFYTFRKVAELPKPVLISRFLKDHGLAAE